VDPTKICHNRIYIQLTALLSLFLGVLFFGFVSGTLDGFADEICSTSAEGTGEDTVVALGVVDVRCCFLEGSI
jgi:hypothetical protein